MNTGLKILLLHWIMIGCASTPKPVTKKKVGAATTRTVKGPAPAKAPGKVSGKVPGKAAVKVPVKAAPPPPVDEEAVDEEEEEEDDQFSRIKKYYKK